MGHARQRSELIVGRAYQSRREIVLEAMLRVVDADAEDNSRYEDAWRCFWRVIDRLRTDHAKPEGLE